MGRFVSPDDGSDQIAADPQSWNLYAYTRNNPIRNIDPTGNACVRNGLGPYHDDDSGGESCADVDAAEKAARDAADQGNDPRVNEFIYQMSRRANASKQMIAAFVAADLVFAGSYVAVGYVPTAIEAARAAQAAAKAAAAAKVAVDLTEHALERLGERGITVDLVQEAVDTARAAGNVATQIGKYGTPQEVYRGANGITVVMETVGRNAGKVVTAYFTGSKP